MVHKQYFPCENMKLWFTLSCTVLVLGLVRSEELSWPQPGSCEWLAGFSTACVHDKMSSFSPAGYGNELLVVRQEFEVKSSAGCTAMVISCVLFVFLFASAFVSHFAVTFPPCLVI